MGTYDRQIATANRLLKKYGKAIDIVYLTDNPTTGQPWKGTAPTGATSSAFGACFDYKIEDIDGSVIQYGDKKVLLAAKGLAVRPNPKCLITLGGEPWKIVSCTILSPNEAEDIIYTLQVRR